MFQLVRRRESFVFRRHYLLGNLSVRQIHIKRAL